MREHKYRFWSPSLKVMSEPVTLHEMMLAHTLPFGYPDGIPLQFTGMHDKDGAEIYDGDIVRGNNRMKLKVGWSQGQYRTGWNINHGGNYYTVIGNIYQSKELVK